MNVLQNFKLQRSVVRTALDEDLPQQRVRVLCQMHLFEINLIPAPNIPKSFVRGLEKQIVWCARVIATLQMAIFGYEPDPWKWKSIMRRASPDVPKRERRPC